MMKTFRITIENDSRKQEFTQAYGTEGYARLSLYYVMADMLDSAIKESFRSVDTDLTETPKVLINEPLND